ncbi:MAG: MFS transporter [Candidatus Brocadia sp. AMX2]|nr:MAG: MFS transporter [Candidatus Brocadia sp. AMX2]MBC6933807.1 MFS transporter [Candidatus Brocadia sp.]MBL1170547.1 MFS transporter [Candidatus Brocadia sp. AMX1]NOG42071.1 AmpG family muropeptide MFS transporter [Planctomycetota bacterium]MCE7868111.1 MFS transporter [Candidatus Brocadia sp. AMX2]
MQGPIVRIIFSWRMLVTFFLGVSSGIPLLVTGSTLQAWMTDEKVNLAVIGMFSLVGLPYTVKFLWAPVMDRYVPPFFGRRRGWMLISQMLLMLAIGAFSLVRPAESPWIVAFLAVLVSFFSASQDIVVDAYRRELLQDEELGLGSSLAVNGYRIGMLISGAFALFLADHIPWNYVYLLLAVSLLIGIITTCLAPKKEGRMIPPKSLREAVIEPFLDYFKRVGAFEILAFILLYKIGDVMASSMTTPFILKMGFTKTELAAVVKIFGIFATIAGSLAGGILLLKLGLCKGLWIFGILQAVSTLSFSALVSVGAYYSVLAAMVTFENLTSGMGTSAFIAFMASLCNKRFTATQYALLSSLMGIPRVIVASPTGFLVERLGWVRFFVFCTLAAIPGLVFLFRFKAWQGESHRVNETTAVREGEELFTEP